MKRLLNRTREKQTCPCCLGIEPRYLYRVNALYYCVACLLSVFGMGPARISRSY